MIKLAVDTRRQSDVESKTGNEAQKKEQDAGDKPADKKKSKAAEKKAKKSKDSKKKTKSVSIDETHNVEVLNGDVVDKSEVVVCNGQNDKVDSKPQVKFSTTSEDTSSISGKLSLTVKM